MVILAMSAGSSFLSSAMYLRRRPHRIALGTTVAIQPPHAPNFGGIRERLLGSLADFVPHA
jgi:hypothetical protein